MFGGVTTMAVDRARVALVLTSLSAVVVGLITWSDSGYPVTGVLAKVSVVLGCVFLLLAIAGKAPLRRRRKQDSA